jgi:hypothetical protein
MQSQPHAHKPAWRGTNWRKAMDMAHSAPRCHAHCKHSKLPCGNPAMKGRGVCRMHGGKGGAPRGERNGNYKHGRSTIARREQKRAFRAELRAFADLLREIEAG